MMEIRDATEKRAGSVIRPLQRRGTLTTTAPTNAFILAWAVFVSVYAATVTGHAQGLPLVGTLGSASRQLPKSVSPVPVVVAVAPPTGHFVLTQACVSQNLQSVAELSGSSVGFIADISPSNCIIFSPDFRLSPREKLMCARTVGSFSVDYCSVTWVIEKP
jgi:hypothetical protein